jgi:hypothetical protein
MLLGEVRHPVVLGRQSCRTEVLEEQVLFSARFANAPPIKAQHTHRRPKPHSKNTGCTVWFHGDRLAIMGEAWEIRNSIHPKPLCEELLHSLRESLADLESLHMADARILALKQSIRYQIQDLEQRICPE